MLKRLIQKQTLGSFDYQWRELSEGDAMLSDSYFSEHVAQTISEELLAIDPAWFKDKRVLDLGCGIGRWTKGLLDLGAKVTAIDASEAAIESMRDLFSDQSADSLIVRQADLFELPPEIAEQKFNLVFSFGVLHHTGDLSRAISAAAQLVADDGLMFLYLYGQESCGGLVRWRLELKRGILSVLPFDLKRRVLRWLYPNADPNQSFDLMSPLINTRSDFDSVAAQLERLGFERIVRTLDTTEIYLRAEKGSSIHESIFRPLAKRPYWFERYNPGADEGA